MLVHVIMKVIVCKSDFFSRHQQLLDNFFASFFIVARIFFFFFVINYCVLMIFGGCF
jgi:hypothetical protein